MTQTFSQHGNTLVKQLFERQRRAYEDTHPAVILPNLVDSREEFSGLRNTLADCQAFIGNPCTTTAVSQSLREQDDDGVKALCRAYIKWLTYIRAMQ